MAPARRSQHLLAALGALVLAAGARAGPEPPEPAPEPDAAFRAIPFFELLGVAREPGIEFTIEIPAFFRERRASNSTTGSMLWAAPADWTLIRQGRSASGRDGMIVVQRSQNLHYDDEHDEFADGTGLNERNLPERLGRHGATAVEVKRLDHQGAPMLLIEAEMKGGEKLRVLYVQLGARTRSVSYIGSRPWDAGDEQAWARLRAGVAAPP